MGNKAGGIKTKAKVLAKDPQYYQKLGKMGGEAGRGHKFAHGKITASEAGKRGGAKSRRGPSITKVSVEYSEFFVADPNIDNHIIEPFQPQKWYKGWWKRSK